MYVSFSRMCLERVGFDISVKGNYNGYHTVIAWVGVEYYGEKIREIGF